MDFLHNVEKELIWFNRYNVKFEWVGDCCLMPAQRYHGENKLILMRWWWGPLCTRPTPLVGFFIVLAHWNNSPRVDMSPHLDTLSWFQTNKSLLFILNAACLAEKKHQFNSLWFDPIGALEAKTLTITPPMRERGIIYTHYN